MKTVKRGNSGFTLVEFLVVCTVISLLIAISFPTLFKYVRERAANDAALSFALDVQKARRVAMQKEKAAYVELLQTSGKTAYTVYTINSSGAKEYLTPAVNISTKFSGTSISSVTGSTSVIVFDESGRVASTSGFQVLTENYSEGGFTIQVDYYPVVFSNGNTQYIVKVYSTGLYSCEKVQ